MPVSLTQAASSMQISTALLLGGEARSRLFYTFMVMFCAAAARPVGREV
jgi:hypothetical protein